jgi:hypothetical protein
LSIWAFGEKIIENPTSKESCLFRRLLRGALFMSLFCVLILVLIYTQAEPFLDTQLRVQFANNLAPRGIHIDFQKVNIEWRVPLGLRLIGVSILGTGLPQGEIEEVKVSLGWVGELKKIDEVFPEVGIHFKNPKLTYTIAPEKEEPQAPKLNPRSKTLPIQNLADLGQMIPKIKNLQFNLEVEGAEFEFRRAKERILSVRDLHFRTYFENLASPIILNFASLVKFEKIPLSFWMPVSVDTNMKLENGQLNILKSEIKVLSLASSLTGSLDLNREEIQLKLRAEVPELEKVPVPSGYGLPFTAWAGALKASFSAAGPWQSPSIDGDVELLRSSFRVALESAELKASGPMTANLQVGFRSGASFEIKKLDAKADLTALEISYGEIFKKPISTPLTLAARGRVDQLVHIDALAFKLAQLGADISGSVDLGKKSQLPASLMVKIHPTDLVGLENFFLPLSQHLMTGSVSLNGSIKGDLNLPSRAKVLISDLNLKNFSTQIKLKTPGLQLEGPIAINLEGRLAMENLKVQSGKVTLYADLSGLWIRYLNLFFKKQNELLKIGLNAEKNGNKLSLRSSQLSSQAGIIQFSGEPPMGAAAPMDLSLDCKGLNLTQLRSWFPSHQRLIPDGDAQFSIRFSGSMDPEQIMKSPMVIRANIAARIPKYVMVRSEPPAETVQTIKPKPTPPQAFLNSEPLLKNMQLGLNIGLGEFELAPLKAQGVVIKGDIKNGVVNSSLSIQNIFDGSMTLSRLRVDLFQVDPILNFEFIGQKLKIEKILAWAMPLYERLIRGEAELNARGSAKVPWAPDFVDSLDVGGDFKLENGVLSTLELGEMLKGAMSSIPGLKSEAISSRGPMQAKMSGRFRVKESQLGLNPFQALTSRHEELFLKGRLDSNLNMDLSGSLFLVEALSGSFFEANKDPQGRLEIPLELHGVATRPEFKFAQDSISKMTAKAVEFEKKKLVQKVETQVKAKIDSELEKTKKDLSQDLKKKAQDFFK